MEFNTFSLFALYLSSTQQVLRNPMNAQKQALSKRFRNPAPRFPAAAFRGALH